MPAKNNSTSTASVSDISIYSIYKIGKVLTSDFVMEKKGIIVFKASKEDKRCVLSCSVVSEEHVCAK